MSCGLVQLAGSADHGLYCDRCESASEVLLLVYSAALLTGVGLLTAKICGFRDFWTL